MSIPETREGRFWSVRTYTHMAYGMDLKGEFLAEKESGCVVLQAVSGVFLFSKL